MLSRMQKPRVIPGTLPVVSRKQVEALDVQYISDVIGILATLTKKNKQLCCAELTIDGFEDDPRFLDQIPEVPKWARHVQQQRPDFLEFQAPASLARWVMWVAPSCYNRRTDGLVELDPNDKALHEALGMSEAAALDTLCKTGIPPAEASNILTRDFTMNLRDVLKGRHIFGTHYVVAAKGF